jgi:hypothetical protein
MSDPTPDEVFEQYVGRVFAQLPATLIAVVLLAAIGFGSGIFETRYNGLRIRESGFLTMVGLFTLCFFAAKALEWSIKRIIRGAGRDNPPPT